LFLNQQKGGDWERKKLLYSWSKTANDVNPTDDLADEGDGDKVGGRKKRRSIGTLWPKT